MASGYVKVNYTKCIQRKGEMGRNLNTVKLIWVKDRKILK
jgi:hypothetical protein